MAPLLQLLVKLLPLKPHIPNMHFINIFETYLIKAMWQPRKNILILISFNHMHIPNMYLINIYEKIFN